MLVKKWVGKVLTFINYYYKTVSIFHHPDKKIVQPSYLVSFNESETEFLKLAARSFNFQVDYSLGFRQKEVFTVNLSAITFLGNSGASISGDMVITESVFDAQRLVKSPAFKTPAWMGFSQKKKGLFTSILHLPWAEQSNYHWFLDCLPRLYYLLETVQEPVQIIVAEHMPAFQLETLVFLLKDYNNFSLVSINKHSKWQLPLFVFSSFVAHHNSGYLPVNVLNSIREKVWRGYEVEPSVGNNRIYISRCKAKKRRILNEEALVQVLEQHRFQIVLAEELTYKQQVQLFYNAMYIIAPHGAGLTNILFSKQCKVWELHPADQVKSHYFMLCKALEFSYEYTIGTTSDANLDFVIDEKDFTQNLQTFLAATTSIL